MSNQIKVSKYNVSTNYKNYTAIHNLVSHEGVLVNSTYSEKINQINENPDSLDEEVKKILLKKGILIEKNVDEMQVIQEMKIKEIKERKDRLSITIIPTYQCNFKCVYCWETTKNQNDSMTIESQDKFLLFLDKQLKNVSALDIDWFGGEPLLAFDVVKRLSIAIDEMCKKYKVPYSCSITSNGYCLTKEVTEFLINYHTHFFQITLDGPAEFHNRNRPLKSGKGTFDQIINNLRVIRDEVNSKFIKVLIRLNVIEDTAIYAEDYVEFIHSEFGQDSRFRMYIQAVERHNDIKYKDMKDKYLDDQSITQRMYDKCIEVGMRTTPLKMLKPGDLMCTSLFTNSYFLSSDGLMYKCDMDMHKDHISCYGEMNDKGDINVRPEAHEFWKNNVKETDYCSNCIMYPLCYGLRCPYYNNLNVKLLCSQYNDYSLVKNAVKSYAQNGKYEILEL